MSILATLGIAFGAALFVELFQGQGHMHDHERHREPHDDLEQVVMALELTEG